MSNKLSQETIREKLKKHQNEDTLLKVYVFALLATFLTMCLLCLAHLANWAKYKDQESVVTAGKIIEKERKDGTIFRPPTYYLAIEWNYEKNGETTTEKKYIEVERDIYLVYEVGDYFDSQNFSVPNIENEITEVSSC